MVTNMKKKKNKSPASIDTVHPVPQILHYITLAGHGKISLNLYLTGKTQLLTHVYYLYCKYISNVSMYLQYCT